MLFSFFFFKQKTAYEMRISDWSSDVCSSDLDALPRSLEEQLAKERRDVLALHIAHDPALALDLTIFRLARKFTGHAAYNDTGVMVTIGELFDPAGVHAAHSTAAQDGLDAVRSGLPCDWAGADDSFSAFMAFRELDETDKAGWLGFAGSQSLDRKSTRLNSSH